MAYKVMTPYSYGLFSYGLYSYGSPCCCHLPPQCGHALRGSGARRRVRPLNDDRQLDVERCVGVVGAQHDVRAAERVGCAEPPLLAVRANL